MQAEAHSSSTRVASLRSRNISKSSKPTEMRPPGPASTTVRMPAFCVQRPAHGLLAAHAVGALDVERAAVGADADGKMVQGGIASVDGPQLGQRRRGAVDQQRADRQDGGSGSRRCRREGAAAADATRGDRQRADLENREERRHGAEQGRDDDVRQRDVARR